MNERDSLDWEITRLEMDILNRQFEINLLNLRLKVLRAVRETKRAMAEPLQAWSGVVREAWKVANGKD